MDVRQVLVARTIKVFKAARQSYLPDLAKRITDRYKFVVTPKNEDLLTPPTESMPQSKRPEFRHGRLKTIEGREIIVQQFAMLLGAGLLIADTVTSTDESEYFLQDFAAWAQDEISLDLAPSSTLYVSQIEFQTNGELEARIPTAASLGSSVDRLLKSYGLNAGPFQLSDLTLNPDPIGAVPPQHPPFQIQRRQSVPYKSNVWWSQAPLKTKDHIKVLRELERQQ